MSVDKAVVQRDREVTREIHRLFWQGNFQDKPRMWFVLLTHTPAFFLQNVLVPVALAYAIQAIVQNHLDRVTWYTVLLVACTTGYNLLLSLGTYAFNKQGVKGGEYVQRRVFSNYLNKDYEFYSDNHFGALGAQASRLRDAFLDYNHFTLFEMPKQTIVVGVGIVVIALKSLPLALLTLGCMILVLGFTITSSRMRLKYRREVGEASSNLAGVMGDALSSQKFRHRAVRSRTPGVGPQRLAAGAAQILEPLHSGQRRTHYAGRVHHSSTVATDSAII